MEIPLTFTLLSLPALVGIGRFVFYADEKWGMYLVLLSCLLLRLYMIQLDPFLHHWDERYHALVAKNMMAQPFRPMLHVDPILDYDYKAWCCNHIWLHKQPLFLWLMALSMKMFGVSEVAMRLPSALLSTLTAFFTFQIALNWTNNGRIALLALLCSTYALYGLELVSGYLCCDHNDVAFLSFITASIWAFTQFQLANKKAGWIVLIGLFAGMAVLTKWLAGLVVFGAWGLWILLRKHSVKKLSSYAQLLAALGITAMLVLPWQLYIMQQFPTEASYEQAFNAKHLLEAVEGHGGSYWFHFAQMRIFLFDRLYVFLILGIGFSFFSKQIDKRTSLVLLAVFAVFYAVFSFAATKMASFTFAVSPLLFIYCAMGIYWLYDRVHTYIPAKAVRYNASNFLFVVIALLMTLSALKISKISQVRQAGDPERKRRIHNTQLYKSLADLPSEYVVLNANGLEEVEVMFYTNNNAYSWWPAPEIIDSLKNVGYKFAAFQDHGRQKLPPFLKHDKEIWIIEKTLE